MTFNDRVHRPYRIEQLGLALLLITLALVLIQVDWLWRWDRVLYDWSLALWSQPPPDDVIIIAVDEQSLRKLGRWPWSRRLHAELIRKLTAAEAKAIGLDIVFAEPDASDPEADAELAKALADNGRVILPVLNEQARLGGQLVETLPIPVLAEAAAGLGHVDVDLDLDGVARSVYLKAGLGSSYWSSLGLALLELGRSARQTPPGQRAQRSNRPSPYVWVRDYGVLVPFIGPPGRFPQVSYSEVVQGRVSPEIFRAKYVLVGVTAPGVGDLLPTPVSGLAQPMSGVEFNANVLAALQQERMIQPLNVASCIALTVVLILAPILLYPRCSPLQALLLAGLSLVFTVMSSLVLLYVWRLWFPPAPALFALGLSYPLWSWRRLQHAVHLLFAEKERVQVTLHSIGDAVITTDAQGAIEYLNPTAEILLGWTLQEVRGQPLGAIFQITDDNNYTAEVNLVARCLRQGQLVRLPESRLLVGRDGQNFAVRVSAAPIRDQRSQILGVVIACHDLTETRRLTQQVAYQATHDTLTRLPNRHLLLDRLAYAITRAHRAGWNFAVLFVDLDHFKKVNEGLGHTAGDRLLQAVTARLQTSVRKEDTIARLSSDEFILILEELREEEQVVTVAQKILKLLELSFLIEGHECFMTASIGISMFPRDGADAKILLKNADTAMRRAKEAGRNNIQFYAQDMNARALEHLVMEQSLRHALEYQELEIHYQPQMELRKGRIVGVEALVRWRHPQRGLIPPMDFVPLAEETGLIDRIGEWVLKTACQQANAWRAEGLPALRVAVNLSPRQFLRPGLASLIAQVLQETGLEPDYLDLEITESLLMKDVENSIATLRAIKAMGVRLSIDDFGTGYSSLSYLKQFPIDQLKIDRSFVCDIPANQDDTAIALAVIAMAHSMQLQVIAEGVENEAQLRFLRENQCDEIQGYYLSRPLLPQQITSLLRGEHALHQLLSGGSF